MQQKASSGSDADVQYVMVDDRKKRRMISNRESARRSRRRKQQHLEELVNQASQLNIQNSQLKQEIDDTSQRLLEAELDNNVLRAQAAELTDRLQSLNSLLQIVDGVNCFSMDVPEIPDSLMEPWQLPFPVQPIMSPTNMFYC